MQINITDHIFLKTHRPMAFSNQVTSISYRRFKNLLQPKEYTSSMTDLGRSSQLIANPKLLAFTILIMKATGCQSHGSRMSGVDKLKRFALNPSHPESDSRQLQTKINRRFSKKTLDHIIKVPTHLIGSGISTETAYFIADTNTQTLYPKKAFAERETHTAKTPYPGFSLKGQSSMGFDFDIADHKIGCWKPGRFEKVQLSHLALNILANTNRFERAQMDPKFGSVWRELDKLLGVIVYQSDQSAFIIQPDEIRQTAKVLLGIMQSRHDAAFESDPHCFSTAFGINHKLKNNLVMTAKNSQMGLLKLIQILKTHVKGQLER